MTTNDVTEIEVLYRAAALMGLLAGGLEDPQNTPELAKDLARRMMDDSTEEIGLAAVKPKRKYNRK
jgi:hypothetical protein